MEKSLVNPLALRGCMVRYGEFNVPILDISFIRAVTERHELFEGQLKSGSISVELILDRFGFKANVTARARGDGWLRLGFEGMVPSGRAHLRSFLSPKKVGESLVEDWRDEKLRHFHGLNESELWFDSAGGVLFTYLDQDTADAQFLFRVPPDGAPAQVGNIRRADYIELRDLCASLPLVPLNDRDVYRKLGECRDVVTNFRPQGQVEYHLKQRLLKMISEQLYSTGHRVDASPSRVSKPNPHPSPL